MKRIAVIGGGGTGIAMAGDLAARGFSVRIWDAPDRFDHLRTIREAGGSIRLTGAREGLAMPEIITSDLNEALAGASLVLISVMALYHDSLIQQMAPLLTDGQVVCFSAGNCGSLFLKRALDNRSVITGEMQGNVFPARIRGGNEAHTAFPYARKKAAAFPAKDTPALLSALRGVYDCDAATDVLETTLNSLNVSVHLAASILGISKMETMQDFRLYRNGLSLSVLALVAAAEQEKADVMARMGYSCSRSYGMMQKLMEEPLDAGLRLFRELEGPLSIHHRYFSEDAYAGNSLLVSLSNRLDMDTRVSRALITIIGTIHKRDYFAEGITLERLGLLGDTPEKIRACLVHGNP